MATIQHVIHLSSCIRVDGVLCLGPGEHGFLEQTRPPFPPPDEHPGHSPRCYFFLIHIWLVFSLLITRQMTTTTLKKKGIMLCSTEAWLLWFLWMGVGGWVRIRQKFRAPLLRWTPQRFFLLQFTDLVGSWGTADSMSMTDCQDRFNSYNGRKGHLTSVIFSNKLQSCCWLALLKCFPCEQNCAGC